MAESADPGEMAARAELATALRDLGERVAALEMAADLSALPSSWPGLTEAEKVGFIEAIAEARERTRHRLLNAPLTPDEVRQLLRECVTVVAPGETLVVRVPSAWSALQVRDYSEVLRAAADRLGVPFQVMIVVGDGLGVAEAET